MEIGSVPKPTDADKAWFEELLPSDPDVSKRPMFGNLAGFVNGNMFLALFGPSVAVRLDDASREELQALGATPFEPVPGRRMKEYVVLPEAWRDDLTRANDWVRRSLDFVRTMPVKKSKPKKK